MLRGHGTIPVRTKISQKASRTAAAIMTQPKALRRAFDEVHPLMAMPIPTAKAPPSAIAAKKVVKVVEMEGPRSAANV